jgi:5-methylcytosine-specific restriction enzyme A
MPTQPPKFSFVKREPRTAWQRPGKNAKRRKRGRAGQRDRAQVLAEEPLCKPCLEAGRVTASEQVDHISDDVPDDLWDERENKQGICKDCHKAKTAREAAAARRSAVD